MTNATHRDTPYRAAFCAIVAGADGGVFAGARALRARRRDRRRLSATLETRHAGGPRFRRDVEGRRAKRPRSSALDAIPTDSALHPAGRDAEGRGGHRRRLRRRAAGLHASEWTPDGGHGSAGGRSSPRRPGATRVQSAAQQIETGPLCHRLAQERRRANGRSCSTSPAPIRRRPLRLTRHGPIRRANDAIHRRLSANS